MLDSLLPIVRGEESPLGKREMDMQLGINMRAIAAFNSAAPTLESVTINGRVFECFRDYWHQRPFPMRNGVMTRIDSIMLREPAKADPWLGIALIVPGARVFKRNSKPEREFQAWARAMCAKYAPARGF